MREKPRKHAFDFGKSVKIQGFLNYICWSMSITSQSRYYSVIIVLIWMTNAWGKKKPLLSGRY